MKPIQYPERWSDRSWVRKNCETTPFFGDIARLKKAIRHEMNCRDIRCLDEWNGSILPRDSIVNNILQPFEMYWGNYKIVPSDHVDALLMPDEDFDIINEISKRCGLRIPYKYYDDLLQDGIPGCLELCEGSVYSDNMNDFVIRVAGLMGKIGYKSTVG